MKEERFNGLKDLTIFFRSWRPDVKRARSWQSATASMPTAVNIYGRRSMQAVGFAVYALDLRGRETDGERFYVDDLADYVSDVAMSSEWAKKRDQECPSICSATARVVSSRASTRWTTRTRSRG